MISKKFTDITAADFLHLIEGNVQERKTLEYKAMLPSNSDGDKKEFLADVSSLANTEGGDLIFGLREVDGVLQSELGVVVANTDEEIARLENIARDGIFPRIGLEMRAVDAGGGNTVILIRTKASLEAPHRVIFKGHDKFYRRNSNGKYAMDVGELRSSFLQSGELTERIRRFRTARITDIKAGDTPLPLTQNVSFVAVHIVPLSSFSTSFRVSSATLSELQRGQHSSVFTPPFSPQGWNHRINLDGVVAYSPVNDPLITGKYTQLYRDGRIEMIDTWLLRWNAEQEEANTRRMIPMYSLEEWTMRDVGRSIQLLTELEVQPPFYVFVSLVGTEGATVAPPSGHIFMDNDQITEKELLLPEVVIENTTDNLHHKFRPVFDMIWNAAGVSRSLNFDDSDDFNARA